MTSIQMSSVEAARTCLLLLIACVLGLLSPPEVLSAPLITNSLVYIDNRPLSDPFGQGGVHLHAELVVTDPGGTAALTGVGAGAAGTASNANFPFAQPFPLFFNAPAPIAGGADFINFLPVTAADFPNIVGSYNLGVRNTSLEIASVTNVLLKPEVLQFPTNITTNNRSTTPTITWTDPNALVAGLRRLYQIQLIDDSLIIFFTGTPSLTPSIAVQPGLLIPGHQYLVRVNIFDVDLSQPNLLVPNPRVALARDYLAFTPIPQANSLFLVATGLSVVFVVARWRSKRSAILASVSRVGAWRCRASATEHE